jgi:hypothetical protein
MRNQAGDIHRLGLVGQAGCLSTMNTLSLVSKRGGISRSWLFAPFPGEARLLLHHVI